MANCHNYKRTIRGHEGAEHIEDTHLQKVLKHHLDPKFWKRYSEPDQYAYVRWWASVCRREARIRGLL